MIQKYQNNSGNSIFIDQGLDWDIYDKLNNILLAVGYIFNKPKENRIFLSFFVALFFCLIKKGYESSPILSITLKMGRKKF